MMGMVGGRPGGIMGGNRGGRVYNRGGVHNQNGRAHRNWQMGMAGTKKLEKRKFDF